MDMEDNKFDYESFKSRAIKELQSGKELSGVDGVLQPLLKDFLESALDGELTSHLANDTSNNRRNGKGKKKVKTSYGTVDIVTPRDRNGSFTPQLIGKRETVLGEALENKILSLYAKGSSYSQIQEHLLELYGLDISVGKLSAITDCIIPKLKQWQSKRLHVFYPVVWLDAIHFKVREDHRVTSKAVYVVLALNNQGVKELLGLYISDEERAGFWLEVLSDIQNRGVEDILITCVDNLKGFSEAIEAVFPKTSIQKCIIHQIRNSRRFLARKDRVKFNEDLKAIYKAVNLTEAQVALDDFDTNWNHKYPLAVKSWRKNWSELTHFFEYSKNIRKLMYTTNIVEGFNRQIRKITKTKGVFTNQMALMKLIYLTQNDITKKWINPTNNWNRIKQELIIKFGKRFIEN